MKNRMDRLEALIIDETKMGVRAPVIDAFSRDELVGGDMYTPTETPTFTRKEIDQAMKVVDNYSLPNKFRGHADMRSSHVWETELRRTISLHGGSVIHLYFAMARS
jgi:hypothetical protein